MSSNSFSMPMGELTRKKLTDLHRVLLHLHKVLLDNEKYEYEKVYGPVQGSGQLLSLVMSDPWFDWLHQISRMIVEIDELTENSETSTEQAFDLIETARRLFNANEDGSDLEAEFMQKYKAVLKREPGAVLAHIEVQKVLQPDC